MVARASPSGKIGAQTKLICVAATLAYLIGGPTFAIAQVLHKAQSGVHIERSPQTAVQRPGLPSVATPQPRQPVPAQTALSKERTENANLRAQRHMRAKPAAIGALPDKTDLAVPLVPLGPAPATAPKDGLPSNILGRSGHTTQWKHLLAAIEADEEGRRQLQLPDLIAQHAEELRTQADATLLARLGWALYRSGRFTDATPWFELALAKDATNLSARRGAFYSLQHAGDLERAFTVGEGDPALQAERADVAVQIASHARNRGDPATAAKWLERATALGKSDADLRALYAWSLLEAGDPSRAAEEFITLHASQPQSESVAQGLYLSLRRSGQAARLSELSAQSGALRLLLRKEEALRWYNLGLAHDAAALDANALPTLTGAAALSVATGANVRKKSGMEGTSRLFDVEFPAFQLRFTNLQGVWDAQLQLHQLDAGTSPSNNMSSPPPSTTGATGRHVGISGSLSWRSLGSRSWMASLGVTPTNGAVSPTWTGSIGWRDLGDDHEWSLSAYRRVVEDSTLSYTGLFDPMSGRTWGRVMREGWQVHGYQMVWPRWSVSALIKLEHLAGQHVPSNSHKAVSIGLARDLPIGDMRFFSLGPNLSHEHYARNLSGFAFGEGGYFSPQRFTTASLLAVFQTKDARRWILSGQVQLGWQSLHQDTGACPPLSVTLSTHVQTPNCHPLPALDSNGIGTSIALRWSTLLGSHWALEGDALLRTGPAYQERSLYLGLRYFFSPRRALFASDLRRE